MPSAAIIIALVGGLVPPMVPAASAQSLGVQSTYVTHACALVKPGALLGAKGQGTVVSSETVVVRFPDTVAPGEVFTAFIQPGSGTMRTTDGRQAGLLSYDVAFPGNSTNLSAYNNGGGSNITGGPATVNRINANGQFQEFGPYARIWGGTSAYLGDNSRTGDAVDRWKAGLQVASDTTFQFPEIALRMRAPVTSGGSTISVGLKGAGSVTGSSSNGAANTIQGGEQGGWGTERTNYYFCSSSADAASLSSTFVNDTLPRYIAKTSTALTSGGVHLPRSARSATFRAQVTTTEELISNVRAGGAAVRFDIRDKLTGNLIASPTGAIGTDGVATTTYQFPDISGDTFREEYEVTATYTGRPGDIASSTSSPTTYSVGYNEINATVALSSTNGVISGGQMPVTVRADLTLPSGRSFPTGGMSLQLYRNGVAHGSPQAVTAGGSTKSITFPVDYLPQAASTTTYKYKAALTPVIIGDIDRYAGESTTAVAAIVTGTDPASTLPEGGHGSIDLTTLFKVPELTWEIIGGSVGGMGTLSTAMADG